MFDQFLRAALTSSLRAGSTRKTLISASQGKANRSENQPRYGGNSRTLSHTRRQSRA